MSNNQGGWSWGQGSEGNETPPQYPAYGQLNQPDQPGYNAADGAPGYGSAGYGSPAGAQPGYGQNSAYGQPGYGPAYGQPAQPGYNPYDNYANNSAGVGLSSIIPLRPLTMGDIFDGAFKAIRSNPVVMFLVALILLLMQAVVLTILSTVFFDPYTAITSMLQNPNDFSGLENFFSSTLILATVNGLMSIVITNIITGILITAIRYAVYNKKASLNTVWAQTRPLILPLIGLSLLVSLIIGAVPLVVFGISTVLTVYGAASGSGAILTLFSLLLMLVFPVVMVFVIVVAIKLSMATPALIMENISITQALRRSWELTKGNFWRILGITLLAAILVGIIAAILSSPAALFTYGSTTLGTTTGQALFFNAIIELFSAIASAVTVPFTTAVTALLYLDLRFRSEGLHMTIARDLAEQ